MYLPQAIQIMRSYHSVDQQNWAEGPLFLISYWKIARHAVGALPPRSCGEAKRSFITERNNPIAVLAMFTCGYSEAHVQRRKPTTTMFKGRFETAG